jgi:hypothetical protein
MAAQTLDTGSNVDWRRLHALGLPAGSVRALLAVLMFATNWGLLVLRPQREVPDYLRDLLFIIMGHYFIFPTDSVRALLPPRFNLGRFGVEHILAAVVGFYFGSRS